MECCLSMTLGHGKSRETTMTAEQAKEPGFEPNLRSSIKALPPLSISIWHLLTSDCLTARKIYQPSAKPYPV